MKSVLQIYRVDCEKCNKNVEGGLEKHVCIKKLTWLDDRFRWFDLISIRTFSRTTIRTDNFQQSQSWHFSTFGWQTTSGYNRLFFSKIKPFNISQQHRSECATRCSDDENLWSMATKYFRIHETDCADIIDN